MIQNYSFRANWPTRSRKLHLRGFSGANLNVFHQQARKHSKMEHGLCNFYLQKVLCICKLRAMGVPLTQKVNRQVISIHQLVLNLSKAFYFMTRAEHADIRPHSAHKAAFIEPIFHCPPAPQCER
jgi:hypothetical protein